MYTTPRRSSSIPQSFRTRKVFPFQRNAKRRTAIENGKPVVDEHNRVLRPLGATSINKTRHANSATLRDNQRRIEA
jgi:hypothetical protein